MNNINNINNINSRFFQNLSCPYFPCHVSMKPEELNCLFCYCPLYTLGVQCGGNFKYTARGVKSCEDCDFPHRKENYTRVLARFPELSALAAVGRESDDGAYKKYKFDEAGKYYYIQTGVKKLRIGYTTGTCAALAASGAARLLLTGKLTGKLELYTPGGLLAEAEPVECCLIDKNIKNNIKNIARCSIKKDGGDDPDITTGHLITAEVEKINGDQIFIDGGEGVGRVTKPGLDQPVGAAAINTIPRKMIDKAVDCERVRAGYSGGLRVIISIPDGAELACKTWNPMLGIEGGISILGTTGIVEPMSEQAMLDAIRLEIHQAAIYGTRNLLLTPGSYGAAFIDNIKKDIENNINIKYIENIEKIKNMPVIKCSNFIGDALDMAMAEGFENILLIGHIGKLIKIAGGIMNTHSRMADCRRELFCAYAAIHGADVKLCRDLMDAATTEACLDLLNKANLTDIVLKDLLNAAQKYLDKRAGENAKIGMMIFSNQRGFLGLTRQAEEILKE